MKNKNLKVCFYGNKILNMLPIYYNMCIFLIPFDIIFNIKKHHTIPILKKKKKQSNRSLIFNTIVGFIQ